MNLDNQLQDMLHDLKGVYKYMARQADSINDIFTSEIISVNAARVMDDYILVDIRDMQIVKKKFDILLEKIKLIFTIKFNIGSDDIAPESVLKYCKGQTDFIEYYLMKNGKQIWKKYYIK